MIAFQAELGSGDYIFVEEGDRLGFLFMDGSRAVGYNFDPSMTTNIQVIWPSRVSFYFNVTRDSGKAFNIFVINNYLL